MLTNMQTTSRSRSIEYCQKCGGALGTEVEYGGKTYIMPVICKCKAEEAKAEEERDRDIQKAKRLESLMRFSLMDEAFKNKRFENSEPDHKAEPFFRVARNYCDKWPEMKAQNVGMTLIGAPGIGKTHIAFCIANELLNRFVPVIAISSIGLIQKVYDSYGKHGEVGENELIMQLQNADLLIIDDLGAEHSSKGEKEKQIIYSVLDSRLRNAKPIIITSNLTETQLREKLRSQDGIDRTFDRLIASAPIIEVQGSPRRKDIGEVKKDILRGLAR